MKICAITMVYRDYWALSQWYAHYSRHLGSSNLYIVAHGYDPKIAELCPRASVITIPRDSLAGFDRMRAKMLNSIQDGLATVFDWVIRTDCDELICLDPERYSSFADIFREYRTSTALFALGMNVVEDIEDVELARCDAVLTKRKHAVFSGHYSKAWAAKRGAHLVRHGVSLTKSTEYKMPPSVYLLHLKYANTVALVEANKERTSIANGTEKGLPGKAWSDAENEAHKFLTRFEKMPDQRWIDAESDAYQKISETPLRDADEKVLRSKSISFDKRTVLPDWFKYC